jgi:tubulin gamma
LVDSEPKVIKSIQDDKVLNPLFPPGNLIFSENGRGNNWALGYSKTYKESPSEKTLCERALESLRKEAESADYFLGTVMTHSLAGGTGSGLGSRLLEEYKDTFGKAYLMTVSIWPNPAGETPL